MKTPKIDPKANPKSTAKPSPAVPSTLPPEVLRLIEKFIDIQRSQTRAFEQLLHLLGASAPSASTSRATFESAAAGRGGGGGGGGGGNTVFTPDEVFTKLCNEVYPRCRKQPNQIRPHHTLVDDLGYIDGSTTQLAPKTNEAFGLSAPNFFIGPDFDDLDTVRDHHAAVCEKLDQAGRLEH